MAGLYSGRSDNSKEEKVIIQKANFLAVSRINKTIYV
jgi:hypothetical protein